jgi:UDP-N-acetylglucosamine 4,6-dehydratase/5-epimerase
VTASASSIDGSSILVTGGTGSFGQVFVRRLFAKHRPARVVVYSRDELKQFEMAQRFNHAELRFFLGDVRDLARLERALKGIDFVVHAAALKQVPAAEYNPIECIKTNVIGAENVINACLNEGISKVIALSTDKAVSPINLAGRDGTRFSVVRYGNVIGSRGSVVPFFKECSKSGKLPITDPRMTRFWIRLENGADFVQEALNMMRGGEIFVPKIASMRITDLATAICACCKQETVGIRPGEKLHELLITRDDAQHTLEFDAFYVIQPAVHLWNHGQHKNYDGEQGRPVASDFEYASNTNSQWLNTEQLRHAIE